MRPYSRTDVGPYSCTAIWLYGRTAVQPYSCTAVLPYGRTVMTLQPCSHTAVQLHGCTIEWLYKRFIRPYGRIGPYSVRPCSRPAVQPYVRLYSRTSVQPSGRAALRPYSRTVLQLHSCLAVPPDAFDRPMICDSIFFGRGLHFFWARLAFFFGRGLHFSSEVRPIRSLFSEAHNPCRALKSTHKGEVRSGSTFPAKKGFTFQKCTVHFWKVKRFGYSQNETKT